MGGLLGNGPSRNFKIFRTHFPAVFRFNGKLYMENFDIDRNVSEFIEVSEENAEPLVRMRSMTPREEFEDQFGPILDEQWQWLKEFTKSHYVPSKTQEDGGIGNE